MQEVSRSRRKKNSWAIFLKLPKKKLSPKKIHQHYFQIWFHLRTFFGRSDDNVFHLLDCCFLGGYHSTNTYPQLTFTENLDKCQAVISKDHMSKHVFLVIVNQSPRIKLGKNPFISKYSVNIRWTELKDNPLLFHSWVFSSVEMLLV